MIKVFTVYDSKAELYMTPFFMHNDKSAQRTFGDAANDPSHMFNKYPTDYALFELGEFDDDTGVIKMHEQKKNLGLAAEYLINPITEQEYNTNEK